MGDGIPPGSVHGICLPEGRGNGKETGDLGRVTRDLRLEHGRETHRASVHEDNQAGSPVTTLPEVTELESNEGLLVRGSALEDVEGLDLGNVRELGRVGLEEVGPVPDSVQVTDIGLHTMMKIDIAKRVLHGLLQAWEGQHRLAIQPILVGAEHLINITLRPPDTRRVRGERENQITFGGFGSICGATNCLHFRGAAKMERGGKEGGKRGTFV